MAEKILDGSDVGAILEEAGCEGVAQRVAGGEFGDIGFADGVFELALHGGFMEVMTSDPPSVGMGAESGGSNHFLVDGFVEEQMHVAQVRRSPCCFTTSSQVWKGDGGR